MDNFVLDELLDLLKRGLLWFLVSVVFTTKELKEEALRHFYSGVVRIPGVCYGTNLIQGYQAIGKLFPQRHRVVRMDYVLGYIKMLLMTACILGIIVLLIQHKG